MKVGVKGEGVENERESLDDDRMSSGVCGSRLGVDWQEDVREC